MLAHNSESDLAGGVDYRWGRRASGRTGLGAEADEGGAGLVEGRFEAVEGGLERGGVAGFGEGEELLADGGDAGGADIEAGAFETMSAGGEDGRLAGGGFDFRNMLRASSRSMSIRLSSLGTPASGGMRRSSWMVRVSRRSESSTGGVVDGGLSGADLRRSKAARRSAARTGLLR